MSFKKTGIADICNSSVNDGARIEDLNVFRGLHFVEERHFGKIKGLALFLPYCKAEVPHYEIKEDIDGQGDGYILHEGEQELGYEEMGNHEAYHDTYEAAENDLQGYVLQLVFQLDNDEHSRGRDRI